MERGIGGFAINGATGEFCLTTPPELKQMVRIVGEVTSGRAEFVCGVGSAGLPGCLEHGLIAIEGGAAGLLLPMPYFFPYEQDDLAAFCKEASERLSAPVLLYNLPQFSSGLQPATVRDLIFECPNIVGIKDSSGSLDILRTLSEPGVEACRIVGSDGALAQAVDERLCDAVISGVASVLPELVLDAFQGRSRELLNEFIEAIGPFPVPWALKWIGEARAIAPASFSQPVSPQRLAQGRALQNWFHGWFKPAGGAVESSA